jgi:hypothetical protein
LFNLSSLHSTHGWPLDQIVDRVAHDSDVELPDDARAVFGERLNALLAQPTVASLAKAMSVHYETANTFHTARVVSDLRPIFGDDPQSGPAGAMVMHTLRIDYLATDGLEGFFVSMTRDELAELAAAVARAQQKDEALRRFVTKAGLEELDATFD